MRKKLTHGLEVSVIFMALFALAVFGTCATGAETQDQIIRGTVNIVLANSHGMVVLTDSAGTLTDLTGRRVGSQDSQKLIRLEEDSVCAIAGLGSDRIPAQLQFTVDVIGILSSFRDQLATKSSQLSFDVKLRALSFLLQSYITGLANIKEVLWPGRVNDKQLSFHLFLVGYDSDRKAKIGSLWLKATPHVLIGGKVRWDIIDVIHVNGVGDGLQYGLAGMSDVGAAILNNPQAYAQSPAVQKLLESAADYGASLRVSDLQALARFIAAETHKKYPELVGGRDQVAVLQNGKIARFEQQSFPPPQKPMRFFLIMDVPLAFSPEAAIEVPKGVPIIWVRDTIVGYQGLALDGNFFLGSELRDSFVTYDGGPTVFDKSNKVVNSRLQIGPPIGPKAEFVRYLVRSFAWSKCVPFGCETY